MVKTNAMRKLDSAKIKYETLTYTIDKDAFSAEAVSDLIGIEYSKCYKTLGLLNNQDVYICVISAKDEIDLKKAASQIGVKNLEMIHVKDLLKYVGYQRGAVSPIGVKKNKGIYFDAEVLNHEEIEISGGMMGIGLKINTKILLDYLKANVTDLVK